VKTGGPSSYVELLACIEVLRSTYVGCPYGASPITLYSPEFTLNPV
jgi:hypothetical protein